MSGHNSFLGPQSMWLGLAVVGAALLGWRTFSPPPDASKVPVAVRSVGVGAAARLEQITKPECVAREGRVWAVLEDGVECMSYVATAKAENAEIVEVLLPLSQAIDARRQHGLHARRDLQRVDRCRQPIGAATGPAASAA